MTTPYPKFYAVNDRPVKLVALATGEVDALVFDFVTGAFVPDRSYFARVMAHGRDIDALDAAAFERRVAELRRASSATLQATPLVFTATGDGEFLVSGCARNHRESSTISPQKLARAKS